MKIKYGIALEALAAVYLLMLEPAFSLSLEGNSFDIPQGGLPLLADNLTKEELNNTIQYEITNLGQKTMEARENMTLAGLGDAAGSDPFSQMFNALLLMSDHMTKQELNDDALGALRDLRQKKMALLDARDSALGNKTAIVGRIALTIAPLKADASSDREGLKQLAQACASTCKRSNQN
jgi:hypothetical protein